MVNHVGKFVENLTEVTAPLRELLKKENCWMWCHPLEKAFRKIKLQFWHITALILKLRCQPMLPSQAWEAFYTRNIKICENLCVMPPGL